MPFPTVTLGDGLVAPAIAFGTGTGERDVLYLSVPQIRSILPSQLPSKPSCSLFVLVSDPSYDLIFAHIALYGKDAAQEVETAYKVGYHHIGMYLTACLHFSTWHEQASS